MNVVSARLVRFLGGLSVVALSFFMTLMVLDHWRQRGDSADVLGGIDLSKPDAFFQSASRNGFTPSGSIAGAVDVVRRLPIGVLEAKGWAVDLKGSGNPVMIYVIVNGRPVLDVQARGERSDVSATLKLPVSLAQNVGWSATSKDRISCGPDKSAMVIAINDKKQFAIIGGQAPISHCDS